MLPKLDLSDDRWLFWVAALIEGEGCITFFTHKSKTSGRSYKRFILFIDMTDGDVIRRVTKLVGGAIGTCKRPPHKPIFRCRLYGDAAIALALRILPLMGKRRASRIREVIRIDREERRKAQAGRRQRTYTGALHNPRPNARRRRTVNCTACGTPVTKKASSFRGKNVFCNRAEYSAWKRQQAAPPQPNHPDRPDVRAALAQVG